MKYHKKLNRKQTRALVKNKDKSLKDKVVKILNNHTEYNLSNTDKEFLTNIFYFQSSNLSPKQSKWLDDILNRRNL